MIKQSTLFLILFVSFPCLAQDTITEYMDADWFPTDKAYHVYYRKKHMEQATNLWKVTDYYSNGTVQMTGTFGDKGLEVRLDTFTFYYSNGKIKRKIFYKRQNVMGKVETWFENGNLDGVCVFKENRRKCMYYHTNGRLSAIEEYEDDTTLISAQLFDSSGAVSANRYLLIDATMEDGSPINFYKLFGKHMYFPQDILNDNVNGQILFTVKIDEEGNILLYEVEGFAHPEIEHTITRAIKKFPKVKPAIYHNRVVATYYTQKYTFNATGK